MIEFNGKSYSGAIIKNDDNEMIVSIMTVESMQDICIALTGVKTVTETQLGNSSVSYSVNNAVQVNAAAKNCFTITFSKTLTVIEEMSEAIDRLLVMALEG